MKNKSLLVGVLLVVVLGVANCYQRYSTYKDTQSSWDNSSRPYHSFMGFLPFFFGFNRGASYNSESAFRRDGLSGAESSGRMSNLRARGSNAFSFGHFGS